MGKRWTVIVVTFGDGETDFGHRVHSMVFTTLAAADQAAVFLKNSAKLCQITIVEDWA
jgi:hypothetical protein